MSICKKSIVILLIAFLFSAALSGCGGKVEISSEPISQTMKAASADYSKYLSTSDLEKATGISGLKAEEKDLTLRFSGSDGGVVYEVKFYGKDFYESEVERNRKYYTDVQGVGDKAAICLPDSPYRLVFAKGEHCIMTQTLARNDEGKYVMSEEQLISIAKTIASRLPE